MLCDPNALTMIEQELYAASTSLIVVAPLFVAAGNYLMLGRLMLAVLPVTQNKIVGLKPLVISFILITLDIIAIVIQATGSGIASSNGWEGSDRDTGVHILIAGLAIQVATVLAFLFGLWRFSTLAASSSLGGATV